MRVLAARVIGVCLVLLSALPAAAHPVPFSYLDISLSPGSADVVVVAHMIDIAHDLNIDPPEQLMKADVLHQRRADIAALLGGRLHLHADATTLTAGAWSEPEALLERQSVRITTRFAVPVAPGTVTLDALMFPYDPQHQSFVNFYESDALTLQAILDASKTHVEYFSGSPQGVMAVTRRFVVDGVRHIVTGPDHLVFLLGLLLLGGTVRQLAIIVSAFTVAHTVALTLAALNFVNPPSRIIDPAIALSIVYVGADNLMVHGGRDMRVWIATAFGVIHGFGFAGVLREMDLSRAALHWSLVSFNLGIEIGQLIVVAIVASALAALRTRSEAAGQRLVYVGSIVVIAAGAFWFIQRVFFHGGLA
jgi:hypothetical protein